ncbi:MAG: DUF1592 domain-containing protein [Myxococcaceae bacterium]|nr:DUF1592 domain-containing protein [Myxococcaceae bacterium]
MTPPAWYAPALAALLALGAGCEGSIVAPPRTPSTPQRPGTSELPPADIGPTWLRQLNASEYLATTRELFGAVPPDLAGLLPTPLQAGGFDNNAEVIGLSDAALVAYQAAAERLSQFVTEHPQRLAALFPCAAPTPRAECVRAFGRTFGRRAFRRPLSPDELDALVALAAARPEDDVRALLEGLLLSPSFLFRVEREVDHLSPYELATRLSFLVLGRGPSSALLDRAEAGALSTPEGLAAEATRLLEEAEAEDALARFAGQWLQVPRVRYAERSPTAYPRWTPAARAAAEAELELVVRTQLQAHAPFFEVLTSPVGFVNADLAPLYGVTPPASGFEKRQWPSDSPRGGLLTLAGTLASTAKLEVTAPITRGLYVRMALMCEPFSVPANVPPLPASDAGALTERERLAQHRAAPACAACHAKLEPLGFALSRYDTIGVYRETDARGAPIDDRGSFSGFDEVDFRGPKELSAQLERSPAVAACAVRHFVRFATGRLDRPGDERLIAELAREVFQAGDARLQTLLVRFVQTDTFRHRRAPGATE